MSKIGDFFSGIVGGPTSTNTTVTTTETPKTNWGLIIGGIVLLLAVIGILVWVFGKKKVAAAST